MSCDEPFQFFTWAPIYLSYFINVRKTNIITFTWQYFFFFPEARLVKLTDLSLCWNFVSDSSTQSECVLQNSWSYLSLTPSGEHSTSANIGCSDQTYFLSFLFRLMMRAGARFPHQRRCSSQSSSVMARWRVTSTLDSDAK